MTPTNASTGFAMNPRNVSERRKRGVLPVDTIKA
jgi:hypothetical protein